MAVDNRSEINDAEGPVGEWTGSDVGAVEIAAGLYYQGSNSISAQFSNTQEYIIATADSGGTAFSVDLSDSTVWLLYKDNLIESLASNGAQICLGDGGGNNDNVVGYVLGGNDAPGLVLGKQYYCLRLDVSNLTGLTTIQQNGNGAPTLTAVAAVGYGALHAVAARGNVDNIWVDRITYATNGTYAFTVNGGTVGTPINFSTLASQDDTPSNGWGIFASGVGSSYTVYASTEFGDATASTDSYFSEANAQIFLDGTNLGATHFIFRVFGNAGGTNSFVLDNCVFVGTGEPAIWDFSDANVNILTITDTQFIDNGTFTFPANTATKNLSGCTFNGCGQINFNNLTVSETTIASSTASATGAILLNTNGQSSNQTDLTFISGPSGHGVEITATGTYNFTRWNFSGYSETSPGTNNTPASGSTDAMVYNNSGGAVTINVDGGTNVTVRNGTGATTTVVANVTASVTRLLGNTEVTVLNSPSPYSWDGTGGQPSVSTFDAVETVSADTVTDLTYSDNTTLRINSSGSSFSGVLADSSLVPVSLAAGDRIRVTVRDNSVNPSLFLFDEFEVSGTPSASTIDTTTTFSGFTSAFGTLLNSANSLTVTVEKVDARYQFQIASGSTVDFLVYRTGSDPILNTGQSITTDNNSFPSSQVQDRNYNNPA